MIAVSVIDTTDYLSLALSLPHISPMSILRLFILCLLRVAPVVSLAPFLGAKLPSGTKMGVTIALATVLFPHILFLSQGSTLELNLVFFMRCLKEIGIGYGLAFLVSMPFYIAQSSGILIDFLRGSSSLQVSDPVMQSQSSSIGQLYNYIFIVVFYELGGPFLFLDGMLTSYTILPVDQFISSNFFQFHHPFWQFVFTLLSQFLALSIQLAAPCIVAILMAEMFLGIANRMAPQVQIAFLGMSLKSLIGLLLLWSGWYFILQQLHKQGILWLQSLQNIVQLVPPS